MKLFNPEAKSQRKQAITVIAILSMVYCGYTIGQSVISIFTGKVDDVTLQEQKETLKKEMKITDDMGEDEKKLMKQARDATLTFMQQSNDNFWGVTILNLVIGGIGFLGALMMFNLDKRGFGLYVTSCLLWVFGWLMFFDANFVIKIMMVFAGVISTGFITFYGFNLKNMNLKYF